MSALEGRTDMTVNRGHFRFSPCADLSNRSATATFLKMWTVQDVANFVSGQPLLMELLRAIDTLAIDDCWLGAGVIRNAVWDYLHDYPVQLPAGSDVDVVYFDHLKVHSEIDLEHRLARDWATIPWSVRNQAGMH